MKKIFFLLAFSILSQFGFSQCPPGSGPSQSNLVVNGDFESGQTGFSSDYSYQTVSVTAERTYAIGKNANSFHSAFQGTDHTSGLGNFMIVNGAGTPNTNVWCQTITVTPNTQYLFATWVSTMHVGSPARLQFSINGTTLGSVFTAPNSINTWVAFNATWNSAASISATICIVNQNTDLSGNDFGLDDISFVPCTCNFTIDAGKDTSVCYGNNIQLHPTTGANSYQWSPAVTLDCSTCESPIASPTVTTTYSLLASYGTCTITDSLVVKLNPLAQANAGNDVITCPGIGATLNGSGGINYSWSPSTGLSNSSIANPIASPTINTSYTLTVTNANGCTGSDFMIVSLFKVNAGSDKTICPGSSRQLNATASADFYQWTPSSGLSCSTCVSPIASPTASTTYKVVASLNGCKDSDFVAVNLFPAVNADAGDTASYCRNQAAPQLNAFGGVSYEWFPTTNLDNPFIANPHASPSLTTTYYVTVTDANGCTGKDSTLVVAYEITQAIVFPADTTICSGQSVQITSIGGTHYSWSPATGLNNTTISNPIAKPTVSTTYLLTVYTHKDCIATEGIFIHVAPDFQIQKNNDPSVCEGESVTLNVTGGDSYTWSPVDYLDCSTCTTVNLTPPSDITYTIAVTKSGCKKEDKINVNVIECLKTLAEFPTAFSPNSDGKNDFFLPFLKEVNEVKWQIFNRWGELIFETNSLKGKWDGKFNQQDQPVGVYVWLMSGTFSDGNTFSKKGNVTLLR